MPGQDLGTTLRWSQSLAAQLEVLGGLQSPWGRPAEHAANLLAIKHRPAPSSRGQKPPDGGQGDRGGPPWQQGRRGSLAKPWEEPRHISKVGGGEMKLGEKHPRFINWSY